MWHLKIIRTHNSRYLVIRAIIATPIILILEVFYKLKNLILAHISDYQDFNNMMDEDPDIPTGGSASRLYKRKPK